jgi:hypothetical protein
VIGVLQGFISLESGQASSIDFGTVPVGTTDTQLVFVVRNDGSAALHPGAITFPTGFAAGVDPLASTIEPGESDTFSVIMKTSAPGTFSGNVAIASDDPSLGSFLLPVTGVVTGSPSPQGPHIVVLTGSTPVTSGQAAKVDFGAVPKGVPKPQQVFTIVNDGTEALTLGDVQVPDGYNLDDPLVTTLAPGEIASFTVGLKTATEGTFAGDVTFTSNSGGTNAPFALPVTGIVGAGGGGGGGGGGGADLAASFKGNLPTLVKAGKKAKIKLKLVNDGDAKGKGPVSVSFYLSTDNAFDAGDALALLKPAKVKLKPGKAKVVKAKFKLPAGVTPGSYFLIAVVEPDAAVGDSDAANNTIASPTAITFA